MNIIVNSYIRDGKQIRGYKRKSKKNKDNAIKVAKLAGGIGLAGITVNSGVPRLLGVRLERHSVSKSTAKKILKSGGLLDPNYGGTGAIQLADKSLGYSDEFKKDLSRYVYISGNKKKNLSNNPINNVLYRKAQAAYYRTLAGNKEKNLFKRVSKAIVNTPAAALGLKGKTLYIPGTDEYFNKNFEIDPDDAIALRTKSKVKVYGNKLNATKALIKQKGLFNLMTANKARVAAGVGILGVGGYGSYKLIKSALKKQDKK